jgi:hypothetical protein
MDTTVYTGATDQYWSYLLVGTGSGTAELLTPSSDRAIPSR